VTTLLLLLLFLAGMRRFSYVQYFTRNFLDTTTLAVFYS